MGGYSDRVLRRAGRFADGWISYYYTPQDYANSWSKVKRSALETNKDPNKLTSITLVPLAIANSFDEGDRVSRDFTTNYMDLPKNTHCTPDSAIRGTLAQCIDQIKKYEEIGLNELVFIPSYYDIQQVERAGKELLPVFSN
jgi:alkanesulfonate monooxygenase SsuD/methylene tetrahydromethanopterin reductase-like flavin-dependent oxidoreductase (luciferase family)